MLIFLLSCHYGMKDSQVLFNFVHHFYDGFFDEAMRVPGVPSAAFEICNHRLVTLCVSRWLKISPIHSESTEETSQVSSYFLRTSRREYSATQQSRRLSILEVLEISDRLCGRTAVDRSFLLQITFPTLCYSSTHFHLTVLYHLIEHG